MRQSRLYLGTVRTANLPIWLQFTLKTLSVFNRSKRYLKSQDTDQVGYIHLYFQISKRRQYSSLPIIATTDWDHRLNLLYEAMHYSPARTKQTKACCNVTLAIFKTTTHTWFISLSSIYMCHQLYAMVDLIFRFTSYCVHNIIEIQVYMWGARVESDNKLCSARYRTMGKKKELSLSKYLSAYNLS